MQIKLINIKLMLLKCVKKCDTFQREKALAFTVPGDEDRDPSLIRKHPPLRFRKLEDQQVSSQPEC